MFLWELSTSVFLEAGKESNSNIPRVLRNEHVNVD